ncbi:MAG: hypothetical protein ABJA83_03110 [Burkholderiaceae bacterium]
MFSHKRLALALTALSVPFGAQAASDAELQELRKEIDALRQSYEARLQQLEARLKKAENVPPAARPERAAVEPAREQGASAPTTNANAFNPAISLILSGLYTNLSQDPTNYRITGFVPSGDIGPGRRGFSLAETELGISANVDPYFYGQLTATIQPDNSVGVEEGFVQTTALGNGLTLKAGRFFSSIGYLNDQHAHTWDFVNQPLAYDALLGGQFGDDGVQLKWVAPTDLYLQVAAEAGRGRQFPASDRASNGAGAWAAYAHLGGDVGVSHTWRAGLSYLGARPRGRSFEDTDVFGQSVTNSFSGSSDVWIADFVWKWSPDGNAQRRNFKFQTEYLWRRESGTLVYDTAAPATTSGYSSRQSGGYAQALYQFLPGWRTALRYDWLDSGSVDYRSNGAALAGIDYRPSRWSWMIDYNSSEFSRIRLQLSSDRSRQDVTDNQVFIQYQMSLGAHGAHGF